MLIRQRICLFYYWDNNDNDDEEVDRPESVAVAADTQKNLFFISIKYIKVC